MLMRINQTGTESSMDDNLWRQGPWDGRSLTLVARDIAADDKATVIWQAIRSNPAAICWSMLISTCVVMEGYDIGLLINFFGYPSFQRKYGDYVGISEQTPSGYQLTPGWQSGLAQSSVVGALLGAWISGWLVSKFGRRKIVIYALLLQSAFLFIVFFAEQKSVLLVGEILCGLPWGVFAIVAPTYASEVLPLQLRVYFTSFVNMAFIIGRLINSGVLRGLLHVQDQWSYRIPFALQWFWPVILCPLIFFAPESPWHLVRQKQLKEAEMSIRRLQSQTSGSDPKRTLATIVYTNNLEEQLSVGTSYRDCFRGFEFRRTRISCIVAGSQLLCGLPFAFASTYFFEQIGIGSDQAFTLGVGASGLALFACLCNWFLIMPFFGRRTVYVCGMFAMAAELIIIGILSPWTQHSAVAWSQAILSLSWTFTFHISVGQLGWALPAEMGSSKLRSKTICLARITFYIFSIGFGTLENYFLNPTAWNLKGYTAFFWGGWASIIFIWAYFQLPETRNRAFHELDILFAQDVPTRKFSVTNVDAFDEDVTDQLSRRYSNVSQRSQSIR